MISSLSQRIAERVPEISGLYYQLILVVGPPRTGKTTVLHHLADQQSWPLININLSLSERLLAFTSQQRALGAPQLLDDLVREHAGDVLLLDNTEVLFSPELQQDPLRLLQRLARNRTVIASWAGEYRNGKLIYADATHPEFQSYDNPDVIIVPVRDA